MFATGSSSSVPLGLKIPSSLGLHAFSWLSCDHPEPLVPVGGRSYSWGAYGPPPPRDTFAASFLTDCSLNLSPCNNTKAKMLKCRLFEGPPKQLCTQLYPEQILRTDVFMGRRHEYALCCFQLLTMARISFLPQGRGTLWWAVFYDL